MTYLAVILGDVKSGKSSITSRCVNDSFDERYQKTIGGEFYTPVNPPVDQNSRLEILDTSGDVQYKNVLRGYYRRAEICVYCVDLTKPLNKDAILYVEDARLIPRHKEVNIMRACGTQKASSRLNVSGFRKFFDQTSFFCIEY